MKLIKRIAFAAAIIFGIVIIVTLFLPSEAYVERSIVIKAPREVVFEQVNDFRNWPKWSYWILSDSTMKLSFDEKTKGEGASYSWVSENMGSGNQSIVKCVPYDSIETKIHFQDQGYSKGYWKFEDEQNGTKVVWGFKFETGNNPLMRLFVPVIKKEVEKSFDQGLGNIKNNLEA